MQLGKTALEHIRRWPTLRVVWVRARIDVVHGQTMVLDSYQGSAAMARSRRGVYLRMHIVCTSGRYRAVRQPQGIVSCGICRLLLVLILEALEQRFNRFIFPLDP